MGFPETALAVGALDILVALLLLVEAGRMRIPAPRVVVALALFFVVRGVERFVSPDLGFGYHPHLDAVIDVVTIVLLVLLVVDARKLARVVLRQLANATTRAREYERARRDYEQLVRHRMMNPLTVIRGAAQTLAAGAQNDPELRQQLVAVIVESSLVLEEIALEPEQRSDEESDLRAVPALDAAATRPAAA